MNWKLKTKRLTVSSDKYESILIGSLLGFISELPSYMVLKFIFYVVILAECCLLSILYYNLFLACYKKSVAQKCSWRSYVVFPCLFNPTGSVGSWGHLLSRFKTYFNLVKDSKIKILLLGDKSRPCPPAIQILVS